MTDPVAPVFWLFAALTLFAALMTVSRRNPVHAALFLILAFFNAAGLLILLGAEFLALILVAVYVGAVAVLFLFVVMMLDVDLAQRKRSLIRHLPAALAVGAIMVAELLILLAGGLNPEAVAPPVNPVPLNIGNAQALGRILYTDYIHLFQLAGLILLVAMVAAIVLTLRRRDDVKRQDPALQAARTKEQSIEIRAVEPGQGI